MTGNWNPSLGPFEINPGSGQLTFNCDSFSPATVDINNTQAPGFQWYAYNFFGTVVNMSGISFPGDGTMVLQSSQMLSTITQLGGMNSPLYHGIQFGGGGYFEAALSWPASTVVTADGFPAWWALAGEHCLETDQWPGQATGYRHFSELDFMEYFNAGNNSFNGTIHDWYGIYTTSFPQYDHTQVFSVADPLYSNTNYYGCLWQPATATTNGFVQFMFNRQPLGQVVSWTQYTNQLPPPGVSAPWTYGIIDQQHMVLILNGSVDCPLKVHSVNVWQLTPSNLTA